MQALKEILGAINTIKTQGPHMQNSFANLLDRFRTRLLACKSGVRQQYTDDYQNCTRLQTQWDALEAEAIKVNATLEDVKQDFSAVTSQQVDAFLFKIVESFEVFKTEGPGRGNIDLSVGLKLMRETEAELSGMVAQRDALVLAQKLFALNITTYPDLAKVSRL